jgi:hypothetical protein
MHTHLKVHIQEVYTVTVLYVVHTSVNADGSERVEDIKLKTKILI